MSQNGKPPIIYGGHNPKRDRQDMLNLAALALIFWILALATLIGWLLSWL